jgi:hypothetical protein
MLSRDYSVFSFMCMLGRSLFVLLRYTNYDYPFGIFKLFLSKFQLEYSFNQENKIKYCILLLK